MSVKFKAFLKFQK